MASNANGNDDYEPAYLSFDDFFVDPMARPFFNNQSPSTAQNANLPVASSYSTTSSGCLTALDSKPSCPPPFPKQSNVPIFSAPTFPGCLSMSSHLRPASLVKGNTIYGSRCGPNSDRKFQSVSRPTHLGTVAAQPCVPHTMTSRSYERNDTVIATPVGVFASTRRTLSTRSHTSVSAGGFVMQPIPQYADLPGYPSGFRPIYSSGFRLNYLPAVPVYSSPSYESYLDAGYSSNYSLKDHHSAYQLPDVTKHSESMLANAKPNNQYACAGFGAFLNDLKPTSLSKKAPFPAITLCNLNPYKDSMLKQEETISKILGVFQKAMSDAGSGSKKEYEELKSVDVILQTRKKRAAGNQGILEPVVAVCDCEESAECGVEADEQKRKSDPDIDSEDFCFCAFDRMTEDVWPCMRREEWKNTTCQACDDAHNTCDYKSKNKKMKKNKIPCMCGSDLKFCLKWDHANTVLNLWEILGKISYTGTSDEEEAAMGFANMTDEVAIVTKAKENIIFAMSALSEDQRRSMSQAKHNLIQKCSFNGKPCDIDKDFRIVSDPTFGNCFTFNFDLDDHKSSLRAGPQYGLRVMLFVNASDYLPTSEAVGVRLTIHDKNEFPFPDTFGYSAPTEYISSFGMRMKKMSRLPAPYGDCVAEGATETYIYKNYAYSTEGCYRSCFQQMIIDRCNCGDPRFPSIGDVPLCQVFNKEQRECLEASTQDLGDIHGSFKCRCQQPCNQTVYTMSYSEAIWPSQSLNITLGTCELEPEECNEQYQENAAMLEIFYEALNFEVLTESEAYGVVKMLADFGGQLGLWSGVSFMTVCEFFCLTAEILYMMIQHHYKAHNRRLLLKMQEDY